MKKLALLLVVCLVTAMLPVPALADNTDPELPVEEAASQSETGAEGLIVEGGDEPEADDAAMPEPAAETPSEDLPGEAQVPEGGASDALAGPATQIDYLRSLAFSPAFLVGYAQVLAETAEVLDGEGAPVGCALSAGTVVYAHDRNLADCLKVAFDTPEGVMIGWMRAEDLRPLSPEQTDAFVASCLGAGDIRFFDAQATLPLQRVGGAADAQIDNADGGLDEHPEEPVAPAVPVEAEGAESPEGPEGSESPDVTETTNDPEAPVPTAEPTTVPTAEPTPVPTAEPTPVPTAEPTPVPTAKPTPVPTAEPTPVPTAEPTPVPTAEPTPVPTATPEAKVMAPEPTQSIHIDPKGPQLKRNEVTLGVGETFALEGRMPDGAQAAIAYSSGDAAVARVSAAGVITAAAPGDARIRAEAPGGTWSECLVHVKKAPDTVKFAAASYSIGKGERFSGVNVIVGSVEGQFAGAYTITSGNRKKVTVDANGVITGKKTGTTTLKVRTYNGLTATCKVKVCKAPKSVKVYADRKTLGVGEKGKLTYKLTKKSAGRVTFASESPAIVSVNAATGEITGLAVGTARIRATAYNGKKGTITITVKPAPKTLKLASAEIAVGVGMKLKLVPTLDTGAAGAVSYVSDAPAIATVAADGTVQGVKVGETLIHASTYNGRTAECKVVVKPAPTAVSLPYTTLYIGVGETVQLKPSVGDSASTFTYKSSSKKRVRAYANGTIKGVKKGSAKITIKTYNGKTFKLKVVVRKAPKWVSVAPAKAELCVGETVQLTCSRQKKSAGAVTYTSGAPAIAKVDAQSGLVTAVGAGKAVIMARSFNGRTSTCTVTVFPQPTWIEASTSFVELGVGQTYALGYKLSPGSRSPVGFASSKAGVAAVDGKGTIAARAVGEAAITLTTNAAGVTDTVSVTVHPAPGKVTLDKTALTLNVDETCKLNPSIPEGSMTSYSYSTSDGNIATVSKDGAVLAVNRGTATLTVTTHNGKTASMKLTVLDPWYPDSAKLLNVPDQLKIGGTWQMEYQVSPADAKPRMQWSSSRTAVATVDSQGKIKAVGSGYTIIRAQSGKNPDICLEFLLAVQMQGMAMTIPARTTDIAGIGANLARIEAIRATTIAQIDALRSAGAISKADASKRRSIVNNIFKDYAFPWMTPSLQKYWKKANSEGGQKDFKPGIVYYGLPYISGSGFNRRYNAAKALSEKRYTNSGSGYYLLNKGKLLNGKYVGNDCSGLVDQAIWGTSSSHSADRTADIAVSSAYKTIKNAKSMRPGDLLCKANAHVIMFLYYTNPEKTQMMMIENGGSDANTVQYSALTPTPHMNTVHCSVMNVSYYTKKGYKVRRLKSLG